MREHIKPALRKWNNARIRKRLGELFNNGVYKGNGPRWPIANDMSLPTVFKHLDKFIALEIAPPTFSTQCIPVSKRGGSRKVHDCDSPEDALIECIDYAASKQPREHVEKPAPLHGLDTPYGACCGQALLLGESLEFVYCAKCANTAPLLDPSWSWPQRAARLREVAEFEAERQKIARIAELVLGPTWLPGFITDQALSKRGGIRYTRVRAPRTIHDADDPNFKYETGHGTWHVLGLDFFTTRAEAVAQARFMAQVELNKQRAWQIRLEEQRLTHTVKYAHTMERVERFAALAETPQWLVSPPDEEDP